MVTQHCCSEAALIQNGALGYLVRKPDQSQLKYQYPEKVRVSELYHDH